MPPHNNGDVGASVEMGKARRLSAGFLILAGSLGTGAAGAADHPDLFRAWSPDFADDGLLSADNASTGASPRGPWQCGGKNIAPAISWSGAPADTRSFAIVMNDPDAAMGRGGNHWVIYDIPPKALGVARGIAAAAGTYVPGDSGSNKLAYHGPCAEPGAKPHHFLFMVYALDIPPGTLPAGLTEAEFMQKIKGHNTAEASIAALPARRRRRGTADDRPVKSRARRKFPGRTGARPREAAASNAVAVAAIVPSVAHV